MLCPQNTQELGVLCLNPALQDKWKFHLLAQSGSWSLFALGKKLYNGMLPRYVYKGLHFQAFDFLGTLKSTAMA